LQRLVDDLVVVLLILPAYKKKVIDDIFLRKKI